MRRRQRQREDRPGPGPDHLFPLNQDWARVRRQLVLTARPAVVPWAWVPPAAESYAPPVAAAPWVTVGRFTALPTWPADI